MFNSNKKIPKNNRRKKNKIVQNGLNEISNIVGIKNNTKRINIILKGIEL